MSRTNQSPWPAPRKKDIQIKRTPKGRLSVRCRDGSWELCGTNETWFALILWAASHGTFKLKALDLHNNPTRKEQQ